MKTRTTYQCEICGEMYDDEDSARACESRGVFDPATAYPIGMIHGNNSPGALYEKLTFAVAQYGESRARHSCSFSLWACRDTHYGDCLGDRMCGSTLHGTLSEYHAKVDHTRPSFQRMVDYLKTAGIPATVWDGTRPVPLAEWLAGRGGAV